MDLKDQTLLQHAIAMLLRPLFRLLIKNEVSYAQFAEMAKQSYVDVSYKHFAIKNRKTTYSRVALLTGMSRQEVVRLAKARATKTKITITPSRAQQVVNGWVRDAEFHDEKGLPRLLSIHGESGSFSALVARYSGDITLIAVLDELMRLGLVRRIKKTNVELVSTGYIPKTDEIEKLRVMSMCASDLLSSAVHNLIETEEPSHFQRQLSYTKISATDAAQFKLYSEAKAGELLLHLNDYISQLAADTPVDSANCHQVGFGMYYAENANPAKES